jgi:phosphoglycerate dehydrogenase-like enzyme
MMLRCAILDDYQNVALLCANWESFAGKVFVKTYNTHIFPGDLAGQLGSFDIIVAMRERTVFNAALLDQLPQLRLLVTTGMRNASIDMDYAAQQGVTVCGTSSHSHPTPEHAWAMLMALCRKIPQEDAALRNGGWQTSLGIDLKGKTLGLIGFGKVARVMARYASAFDIKVLAYSRSLTPELACEHGVEATSCNKLLALADIVSLHVTLSESTRGMIGEEQLAMMKPGALLLNSARGLLVDNAALIANLQRGHLAGAAVDVFEDEPIRADHPLLAAPNTVLTPHLGYVTRANYARYYGDTVENIGKWIAGVPIRVLAAPEEKA